MSETPNPYRAPAVGPEDAASEGGTPGPLPSWVFSEPLEFEGEITRQHHRDAVVKAGIRVDYRSITQVMLVLATLFAVCAVVSMLAFGGNNLNAMARALFSVIVFLTGVVVFCVNQRRFFGKVVPDFQLIVGKVRGRIDGESLQLESDFGSAYAPLRELVSCAATQDLVALSFGTEQLFWQTLPMNAFRDPGLARTAFDDLQQIRPPAVSEINDPRRLRVPEGEFQFEPGEHPIFFAGNVYDDSAESTRFWRASRQIMRRTWLALSVLVICLMLSILILTGYRTDFVLIGVAWTVVLFGGLALRLRLAKRRARKQGRVVAWYAKGWLDETGYCSMTTLGQMKLKWEFFDHFEITDKVIALYPHTFDGCCCLIAMEEFADEADWRQACDLVRRRMASRAADS